MRKDNFIVPEIELPGIYGIWNIKTNKMYIGSALNLKNRLKTQRNNMRAWNGLNNLMSEDMKKPEDIYDFVFVILKVYDVGKNFKENEMRSEEAELIDKKMKEGLSYNVHRETFSYSRKK